MMCALFAARSVFHITVYWFLHKSRPTNSVIRRSTARSTCRKTVQFRLHILLSVWSATISF